MKTRKTLFFLLIAVCSFLAKAQEKYEFMVLEYHTEQFHVAVSINGKEFSKDEFDEKLKKSTFNANPLLLKVDEYQDKGWEVMSFNSQLTYEWQEKTNFEVFFAYLRKKKNTK